MEMSGDCLDAGSVPNYNTLYLRDPGKVRSYSVDIYVWIWRYQMDINVD